MRFNRKAVDMGGVRMPLGVHKAKFSKVEGKKTQSGKSMIAYTLISDGKTQQGNLVDQGTAKFENGEVMNEVNMNRILASAFDAGTDIPDKEWTFKLFFQFIKAKLPEVYVLIRKQKNNEQYNEAIFISKDQYEAEAEQSKDNDDDFGGDDSNETSDPFADGSGTEVEIDDDDLPF